MSTNLPLRLRIFSSAADEISAGGDLLFVLAEGEPASLQYDQRAVSFCGEEYRVKKNVVRERGDEKVPSCSPLRCRMTSMCLSYGCSWAKVM